jgi:hypothetical protein
MMRQPRQPLPADALGDQSPPHWLGWALILMPFVATALGLAVLL